VTVQAMGYFWVGTSNLDDWSSLAIGQLGLQAVIPDHDRHVRFVPKADIRELGRMTPGLSDWPPGAIIA